MIVLALDTSMSACSACVYDTGEGRVAAARFMAMERGQAEALAPMVQDIMRQAGLAFAALDRIVATVGPGTFTGVRIGLALARGLAVARGCTVSGLSTLAAIAANNILPRGGPLLVANDARNGEIYTASFGQDGRQVAPPALQPMAAVAVTLRLAPCLVLGTAADALLDAAGLPEAWRSRAGDLPVAQTFIRPALAHEDELLPPEPLYLRAPDIKLPPSRPPLVLTPVGPAAAPVLAALHRESFGDHPWDESAMASLLQAPGAGAHVAGEAHLPHGFILFRAAADEAEILTLAVRPAHRRSGAGAALVRSMEKAVQAAGATTVFLEVAEGNAAARALYHRLGYRTVGRRGRYYQRPGASPEDALVLRKALLP
jgi:tRNA threonylcarbamoyladenosine biosynthesis protein TsaB